MDDDLHVIYLATPLTAFPTPWERYYELHQALPAPLLRIAARIGVDERFLFRARTRPPTITTTTSLASAPRPRDRKAASVAGERERPKEQDARAGGCERDRIKSESSAALSLAARAVQIHARFFAALILRELLLEVCVVDVADKYHVPRGLVQQV